MHVMGPFWFGTQNSTLTWIIRLLFQSWLMTFDLDSRSNPNPDHDSWLLTLILTRDRPIWGWELDQGQCRESGPRSGMESKVGLSLVMEVETQVGARVKSQVQVWFWDLDPVSGVETWVGLGSRVVMRLKENFEKYFSYSKNNFQKTSEFLTYLVMFIRKKHYVKSICI